MDIACYREFIELASRLNFHDAAKHLNMSQSSLSKHILALESFYGTQLLDRTKKRVELTESGGVFLEQALKIWEAYEESIEVMKAQSDAGFLRLTGLIDSPDEYQNMGRVLAHMRRQGEHRISTISSQSLSPRHLADLVAEGKADCAVSYFDESVVETWDDTSRFSLEHICSRPIDAIVSSKSALAQKSSIQPVDLAGATFVHLIGPLFTPIWDQIEKAISRFGIPYTVRPHSAKNIYDYANLDLRDRILLMPRKESAVEIHENPNYRVIPVDDPDFKLDMKALYLADNDNPSLPAFIEAMKACYVF